MTALLRTGDEDNKLDRDMVDVSVDVDADGEADDTIETTAGHEFWTNLTEASNDGAKWVPARDLASGAWLRTSSGTWVQTTAIATETRPVNTYNLTIANTHTYYIQTAAADVLVHNCPPSDELQEKADIGEAYQAEYTTINGQTYRAHNKDQFAVPPRMEDIFDELDHHGGCAEMKCLIQAYDPKNPDQIKGGVMDFIHVGDDPNGKWSHGDKARPCGRCSRVLSALNILW